MKAHGYRKLKDKAKTHLQSLSIGQEGCDPPTKHDVAPKHSKEMVNEMADPRPKANKGDVAIWISIFIRCHSARYRGLLSPPPRVLLL